MSEWLEEQLEQRGIDAIVYTRYVLSLLLYSSNSSHSGSSDQVWTWQDMRRRSSSTRNTSVEEAERQRRLAAVNCLEAASDHPHHIESLVDELCDRLKRVNSDTEAIGTTVDAINAPAPAITMNRHDLARRYYAAFPALQGTPQATGNSSSGDVILVQQEKWPLKRHGKEMNLATPPSKYRYTNGGGGSSNSAKRRDSKRLDYASAAMKKRQMVFQRPPGIDRNWFITSRLEDWHTHNPSSFTNSESTDTNLTSNSMTSPNCDYTINDALALDIVRDILDDSSDICTSIPQQPQQLNYCCNNLHQLLSCNSSVTAYNNKYITNGTNIITSIWSSSEDDMAMGWVMDKSGVCLLQEEDDIKNDFDDGIIAVDEIDGYLDVGCRWSEAVNYENQMLVLRSLEMLNHSQEFSGFTEVMPKSDKAKSFNPLPPYVAPLPIEPPSTTPNEEDDLLHSTMTHFRPITPLPRANPHPTASEKHQHPTQQYADGTTFYVSCTLDAPSYERSEDGASMWLDLGGDDGRVEYMSLVKGGQEGFELKFKVGNRGYEKGCQTMTDEDVMEKDCERVSGSCLDAEEFYFPGDVELLMDEEELLQEDDADDEYVRAEDNCIMEELFGKFIETEKCDKCSTNPTTTYLTPTTTTTITTSNQQKNIWDAGELCVACLRLNAHSSGNGSNTGNDMIGADDGKKKDNNQQQEELRYDVTKDGEQLLSDLSSIQNRYMMDEERMSAAQGYYYGTDIGNKVLHMSSKHYDYPNELTSVGNTADCLHPQQTNNNHHHHPVLHSASFSFASRLQEDCLIKMATMPTLRSVTL